MKRLLIALGMTAIILTIGVAPASAQAVTQYTLTILNGVTVVSTTVISAPNFLCGQAPVNGTAINPRHIEFTDPANAALVCLFTDNGTTGPISSLPFGPTSYTATLIATNSVGNSPVSAPSNSFTEPGSLPGALTGVRVVQ